MKKKYYAVEFEASWPWNEWCDGYLYMTDNEFENMKAYLEGEDSDFDMDTVHSDILWKIGQKLYGEHVALQEYEEYSTGKEKTPLIIALEEAKEEGYEDDADECLEALVEGTWKQHHSELVAEMATELGNIDDLWLLDDEDDGIEKVSEYDFVVEVYS